MIWCKILNFLKIFSMCEFLNCFVIFKFFKNVEKATNWYLTDTLDEHYKFYKLTNLKILFA